MFSGYRVCSLLEAHQGEKRDTQSFQRNVDGKMHSHASQQALLLHQKCYDTCTCSHGNDCPKEAASKVKVPTDLFCLSR